MGQGTIQAQVGRRWRGGSDQARVVAIVRDHAASMLRVARKHSLCADDAQDAYQRALVVYLERADRIDPGTAGQYLRTVVKHDAIAIRELRLRATPEADVDFDSYDAEIAEPHERAESFDRVARAAEALRECKRDEIIALLLSAQGNSYDEISALTGWSRTKVCIPDWLKPAATSEPSRKAGSGAKRSLRRRGGRLGRPYSIRVPSGNSATSGS